MVTKAYSNTTSMRLLLFILCIFYCSDCFGQSFIVMDVSGKVQFDISKESLKIGAGVNVGDRIRVSCRGVILLCSSQGHIKLAKRGLYIINEKTVAKCRPGENSFFSQVIKFKWHEFMHAENPNGWRNHLENIAGVYRGESDCAVSVDSNLMYVNFFTGNFSLNWTPNASPGQLYLKVYENTIKQPVLTIQVGTKIYSTSDLKKQLKEGKKYFLTVTRNGDECKAYNILNLVSAKVYDSVVGNVCSVESNCVSDTAELKYKQGILFESKRFFADALQYYNAAAKLAPENRKYSGELQEFKHRYTIEN